MSIAVTGASGHLGANLVRRLLNDGHAVTALTYEESPALKGLEIRESPGNILEPSTLEAAFHGADTVYHLAAMITISKAYLAGILSPQPLPRGVRSGESVVRSHSTSFPVLDGLLGEKPWLVSIEILKESEPSSGAERWHLQVTLAGPPSPGRIEVVLISGEERCTAMVNEKGEALFKNVYRGWLVDEADNPADDTLSIRIRQIEA